MFRNRSFRTKLALAIAPPLLVLVAVVATVVRPRVDDAADAAHQLQVARFAELNMQVRDELQIERDLTIQRIVSRPGTKTDLTAVRQTTDTRAGSMRAAADRLAPASSVERGAVAASIEAVDALAVLRGQIDTGTVGPFQVFESYELLIDRHLEPSRALVRTSGDSSLQRLVTANVAYLEYKNAVARMNAYLGLRLESGTVTQTDLLRAGADLAVAEEHRKQFLTSAPPEAVALQQAVTSGPQFAAALDQREQIELSGARNTTPNVSPSAWWETTAAQLEVMDDVEDRSFAALEAQAATAEQDAKRDTTIYLSALGIGVLLAALAALALARSISGRLLQVTSDARTIASDRLPEVLDALRNPTPEVLASALPQVTSDSTDEIGSLAESFNTVLRTSVETSINHAQRRAATLTNILVNLGRRNQALIDRQLELVDELESSQRDPDVLRGLFQLDHMITSLRRNAENLLVLASDTQARAWSAPVPMVDVVRGAVAEVEDMSRIALELDLSDSSLLAGRHAVDLSHLIAELVDNALAFSPPSTSVHLRSERTPAHYRVWVLDHGVGMTEQELGEANQRVANPPDVDELSADRIGFQVVGRLARRLGVSVRLQPNPGGGIAAAVTVPSALLDTETSLLGELPPMDLTGPSGAGRGTGEPRAVPAASAPALATPVFETPTIETTVIDTPALGAPPVLEPVAEAPVVEAPVAEAPVAEAPFVEAPAAEAPAVEAPFGRTVFGAFRAPDSPAPLTTASGLQRRVPGQAFVGDAKAQEFDSGQFRRLPMPGDRPASRDEHDLAQHRLDALSGLQAGAGRARDEFTDDEQ